MNTHLLALQLMAAQGCLGGFDTLYHHELTIALPQRTGARRELAIHGLRALIYSLLFVGLSAWVWQGLWALVLFAAFAIETMLTLWDFVVEDQTRLLPASERITHTLLAINAGAFIVLLALDAGNAWAMPSALLWQPHGLLSVFLGLCGLGVGISGLRDALASFALHHRVQQENQAPRIHFSSVPQKVLISGASGFIGQGLVRALLADGQQVTILSRNPKQTAWMFDGRVRCIASMDELPDSEHVDVIINLAGARILGWPWTAARKRILCNSRVGTSQNLVAWIQRAQHKPRLLLSASAIGYYGIQQQDDSSVLTEASPPQSIFMSTLCQQWEAAAGAAAASGTQVICMRFGIVLGHGGALPIMLLPVRLGMGGRLGHGRQRLSWIHIEDVLRGMAHLWRLGEFATGSGAPNGQGLPPNRAGAFNFTAPQCVTQLEFNQIAGKVLHRPGFCWTPGWLMRLALGEQADLLLEGQQVYPQQLLNNGFEFRYPSLDAALPSLFD